MPSEEKASFKNIISEQGCFMVSIVTCCMYLRTGAMLRLYHRGCFSEQINIKSQ